MLKTMMRLLYLLIIFSLSACSTYRDNPTISLNTSSSDDYFSQVYQKDLVNQKVQDKQEYLTWISRFYNGWELYPNGWNQLTDELVAKQKTNHDKVVVKAEMKNLGLLISSGWAKNNKTRLINTNHVSIWTKALIASLEEVRKIFVLLDQIKIDTEKLLARSISSEAITNERYHIQEEAAQFDKPL